MLNIRFRKPMPILTFGKFFKAFPNLFSGVNYLKLKDITISVNPISLKLNLTCCFI